MNKRIWIYVSLILCAGAFFSLVFWSSLPTEMPKTMKAKNQPVLSSSSSSLSESKQDKEDDENFGPVTSKEGKILRNLFKEILAREGIHSLPSAAKLLQDAVASGDKIKISRAFNDAVYRQAKTSEVIPLLKTYLNDANPFVRYLAGQYLFVVGDQSGYDTLLALVQSSTPLEGLAGTGDLRVQAATILAQFRQTDAVSAISALYSKTPSPDLSQALANLGAQVPGENQMLFVASTLAITEYAKGGATQFIPQITATFNSTQNPDVKAAAAWALATMTGDQNAANYLVQIAQADLNDPSQTGSVSERNVISYLGSIQTAAAKQTLESALSSSDPGVVQIAALNLVFNQGGSSQVNQMVASELTGSPNLLGADLALNLATTQMLNDPQVQAAGQSFSQHDGSGAWQRALDRKNWSTYNWMSGVYIAKPSK